jgi:transcriptional regulator with XRE-family HTH domain
VLIAFGAAINRLRKEQGVSQAKLALLSGIDRAYVRGIEKGDQNPGLITIMRVVRALDLTLTELAAHAEI